MQGSGRLPVLLKPRQNRFPSLFPSMLVPRHPPQDKPPFWRPGGSVGYLVSGRCPAEFLTVLGWGKAPADALPSLAKESHRRHGMFLPGRGKGMGSWHGGVSSVGLPLPGVALLTASRAGVSARGTSSERCSESSHFASEPGLHLGLPLPPPFLLSQA